MMHNKSWKSFDSLVTTPSPSRTNRSFHRGTIVPSSSRAIAQLKTSTSPLERRSTLHAVQTYASTSENTQIEDTSSEDEKNNTLIAYSATISASFKDCSAPSLDPKDVTACEKSHAESDIEDVSEPEAPTKDTLETLEILVTSSDDSDCEAIYCKRNKRLKLDFVNRKSPGCGRRITDDIFMVENATERAIGTEHSSTWINSVTGNNSPKTINKRTPKRSSIWKRVDQSFQDSHPVTAGTSKSPPNRKWKTLDNTFRENSATEIEADLTPENLPVSKTNQESSNELERVPDGSFYDPTSHQQWPSRKKYRKDCPLSRFNQIMRESSSMQVFWLHERQMNLLPAKKEPVQIASIGKLFGRIAISYYELDKDEPETEPIEHILYVDPGEKQLKTLRKGSRIEVEYDLAPHKLFSRKIVHLGVCKIRAVD